MVTRKTTNDVSEAINTISYRIEKTESDFLGHLQKVENKLEQIAELTRTVAVLQQQTNQQTDQITEIRTQIRELSQKSDGATARIHSRLDEMNGNIRDKLDLHSKEHELRVKSVETRSDINEKELKQWLNRGIGALAILGIVASTVQVGFYRWIDSIEKDRTKVEAQANTAISTVDKHTQQIDQLSLIAKEQQLANKKFEQAIIDVDRRLDQHVYQQGSREPLPQKR